jgi:hypothetical protein
VCGTEGRRDSPLYLEVFETPSAVPTVQEKYNSCRMNISMNTIKELST